MSSFEDLEVWKRAVALSVEVYEELRESKDYGFRDQITRSALSIASNIAEGMERETKADKTRYLTIAKGSCGELRTQATIGVRIGYISANAGERWVGQTRGISAMLVGLRRHLRY
ncbi:MAG: four helix bundle protein [Burkholderiales bacterium]|nr:four helix bundle protein [Burkholderiales bacterium]